MLHMAVVYRNQRRLGKIWPNGAGAIVAATIGGKRIGLFTSECLAIMALMDCADKPLEPEPWIEWCDVIAASLTSPPDALTEPEHLVEQPPVRKAMEMLLNPW
jgi:hypothetical protein